MSNRFPSRKNPSPGVHIYSFESALVFLTVKTKHRIPWLTTPEIHHSLRTAWQESTTWLVGPYIIMPDHLHLFCAPRDSDVSIENWITFWKRFFRRQDQNDSHRFQSRGWHHRLRADEDRESIFRYMMENPVRKNLVNDPSSWPYQGTLYPLW